jgi:hypothetical protein
VSSLLSVRHPATNRKFRQYIAQVNILHVARLAVYMGHDTNLTRPSGAQALCLYRVSGQHDEPRVHPARVNAAQDYDEAGNDRSHVIIRVSRWRSTELVRRSSSCVNPSEPVPVNASSAKLVQSAHKRSAASQGWRELTEAVSAGSSA